MKTNNGRPALWTKDFILAFLSNLLMFFSFYMLIPVLPFYVIGNLGTSETIAGVVIALYTISALVIRPFSGYLVDKFSRKPLYLLCYGCFCAAFAGYAVAASLMLFILIRIFHGFGFGISTVSGSTVAVDIMPSERRGEGIGYYGMAASLAMATGPFIGLWMFGQYDFMVIFMASFIASLVGFICILFITPIKKPIVHDSEKPKMSLDRFILVNALPCVILLLFQGFGYGAVSNFIGLYSEEAGMSGHAGLFFLVFAIGIVCARLLTAKSINNGRVVKVIFIGSVLLIVSFILFTVDTMNIFLFYSIALISGAGYGHINPAFQSMYINMGGAQSKRHGKRHILHVLGYWNRGRNCGGRILYRKIRFSPAFHDLCGSQHIRHDLFRTRVSTLL
ncbi:MAG: MFS transporter [Rikenellaceae bacterium]|nr:MFS transporter [Rikenellaceae bacterium]